MSLPPYSLLFCSNPSGSITLLLKTRSILPHFSAFHFFIVSVNYKAISFAHDMLKIMVPFAHRACEPLKLISIVQSLLGLFIAFKILIQSGFLCQSACHTVCHRRKLLATMIRALVRQPGLLDL